MTSLTMQNSWTAPTMLSRWTETPERTWSSEPTIERAKTVGRVSVWVGTIDTAVRVLTPVVVAGGVMFAALMWPSPAHADPVDPTLNAPGPTAAQADPIKGTIAEFGRSASVLGK
ncbi:hypothetical protein [Candidatus Mycolicibacterium alkanivorans]|uniref:Uncharacterized protein n=1 Tax=Candidatus Mycolicibacterium alkanivorans TaxID=2954114 RepID=A0ABS9YUG2_9MYCO|nr:hypothetical protein [Candidatus Mycolicibacterium alkanivorans]MCI4674512.1 hypothetical protein [Candidatus Mycolicibacterium alkanivorans]